MQSAENKEKSWERGQRVEANICCKRLKGHVDCL